VAGILLVGQNDPAKQLDAWAIGLEIETEVEFLGERGAGNGIGVVDVGALLDLELDVLGALAVVEDLAVELVLEDAGSGVSAAGLPRGGTALEAVLQDLLTGGVARSEQHQGGASHEADGERAAQ